MYTNRTSTLYRLIDGVYERFVCSVFWQDSKISNFNKTGLITCDTVTVFIPHNGIDLTFTTGKDYIVRGECLLEIDNSTPQALSISLKELEKKGFVTVMSADPKLYGTTDMWHYQLSCK